MKINSINNSMFSHQVSFGKKNNTVSTVTRPMGVDTVSFSAKKANTKKLNVSLEDAQMVAKALSTSTSGYRAEYGTDKFNKDLVEVLTVGVAEYVLEQSKKTGKKPVVMVGGDTRKATKDMVPVIADIFSSKGIDVVKADKPVPTPVYAQMVKDREVPLSILLTASHNPWTDGGYNLLTDEGAIAPPTVTEKIAKHIVDVAQKGNYEVKNKKEQGKVTVEDFYPNYVKALDNLEEVSIDWKNIKDAKIKVYYDALKGTGSNVFPRLMKDKGIKIKEIDSGFKKGPNPVAANLVELAGKVKSDKSDLVIGLANDGDADRFGIVDEKGNFVTPNEVLLLTAYHLNKNKGLSGAIVRSQATSAMLDQFAKAQGIKLFQTPVGFKYIGEVILDERKAGRDVLVAGEESGGLTVAGHIPEKDGILAISLMLDLMAAEKKPISEILKDAKESMSANVNIATSEMTYKKGEKDLVMKRVDNTYNALVSGKVDFSVFSDIFELDVEKTLENQKLMESYKKGGDGYKLYMTNGSTVLIRKSGTEDKVKAYIEVVADKNMPKAAVATRVNELKAFADKLIAPLS